MRNPRFHLLALAAVGVLVFSACGGGEDTEPTPATDDTTSAPTTSDAPSVPSDMLMVTAPVGASTTGFAETELTASADTPFTIHFVNDDSGIPHNIQIFEGTDTSATPVWAPKDNALITGPDEVDYDVPALPAGSYTFNCLSHPAAMVGTLTVQ